MNRQLAVLTLFLFSFFSVSFARTNGAQSESCYNHSIIHSVTLLETTITDPSEVCTDPCDYKLAFIGKVVDGQANAVLGEGDTESNFTYEYDTIYELQIRRTAVNGFTGFLVQARENTTTFDPESRIYGTWENNTHYLFKPLLCRQSMNSPLDPVPNSATQRLSRDIDEENSVSLYWRSPLASEEPPTLVFWFTIVHQLRVHFLPVRGPMAIPGPLPVTTSTTQQATTVEVTSSSPTIEEPSENDTLPLSLTQITLIGVFGGIGAILLFGVIILAVVLIIKCCCDSKKEDPSKKYSKQEDKVV